MSSDIEKEPLSRQQKKSKETKARIFHAAKTILQKQGYDQLSIKNICDEAGVSNGSFYHHFKTKDDLLSYYIEEQPSINPDLLDTPEDADEAKIGIEGVNSTLATAIRTAVVLLMSWGMVFLTGTQAGIAEISRRSWLFLVLSGLATGASWLCYYHALQVGAASKVVPIDKLSVVITLALAFVVLHEPFTAKSLIGCALITAGTLFMVL